LPEAALSGRRLIVRAWIEECGNNEYQSVRGAERKGYIQHHKR
jgi:hypothetical protein